MLNVEMVTVRLKQASAEASYAADAALTSTAEAKGYADDYFLRNAEFVKKYTNFKSLVESLKIEADVLHEMAGETVSAAEEALSNCKEAQEAAREVTLEMGKLYSLFPLHINS